MVDKEPFFQGSRGTPFGWPLNTGKFLLALLFIAAAVMVYPWLGLPVPEWLKNVILVIVGYYFGKVAEGGK